MSGSAFGAALSRPFGSGWLVQVTVASSHASRASLRRKIWRGDRCTEATGVHATGKRSHALATVPLTELTSKRR